MNKKWNVVALMVCALTLSYIGCAGMALYTKAISFDDFSRVVMPIVTAWGGYLAALLNKPDGAS